MSRHPLIVLLLLYRKIHISSRENHGGNTSIMCISPDFLYWTFSNVTDAAISFIVSDSTRASKVNCRYIEQS